MIFSSHVHFKSWRFVSGEFILKLSFFLALLQHKENFKEMDAAESQRLVRGQKDRLDYEVRKFRRRRLVKYHDLEQDLLREVLRNKTKHKNQTKNLRSWTSVRTSWSQPTRCCCATTRWLRYGVVWSVFLFWNAKNVTMSLHKVMQVNKIWLNPHYWTTSSSKNTEFCAINSNCSIFQELETKQQRSVHGLRENQLTTQHRTELGNQVRVVVYIMMTSKSSEPNYPKLVTP